MARARTGRDDEDVKTVVDVADDTEEKEPEGVVPSPQSGAGDAPSLPVKKRKRQRGMSGVVRTKKPKRRPPRQQVS
jgi:hypothetical protein